MKGTQKYLKEVKNLIPVYGANEKALLNSIKELINNLDNSSYESIVEELGEPKDIVASYYHEIDTSYLMKQLNIKKYAKICIIIVICAILLTSFWKIYTLNKAYEDFVSQTFGWEEKIEEIENIEEISEEIK